MTTWNQKTYSLWLLRSRFAEHSNCHHIISRQCLLWISCRVDCLHLGISFIFSVLQWFRSNIEILFTGILFIGLQSHHILKMVVVYVDRLSAFRLRFKNELCYATFAVSYLFVTPSLLGLPETGSTTEYIHCRSPRCGLSQESMVCSSKFFILNYSNGFFC